jgi:hypothetical protein
MINQPGTQRARRKGPHQFDKLAPRQVGQRSAFAKALKTGDGRQAGVNPTLCAKCK